MKKSIVFAFSLSCIMGFSQTGLPQNIIIDGSFGISDAQDLIPRDLNNDNKKDVLVRNYYRDLYWIKNTGTGFEHPELIYKSPVDDIKDYNSADFDGDGKTDIIFSTKKGLFLMKGTSSGGAATFTQPIALSDQNIPLFRIADIDGDGDQDIYLHQPISGTWLKNNGNGTFTPGSHIFSSLQKPDSVILRDLDNDNKPDLLVRINESRILRWYKNDGSGNFTVKQTIDDFALGEYFEVGDIDSDGDLDIIHLFENGNIKQFKWYKNTNGAGTFSTSQLISDIPAGPYAIQNVKRYGVKMLDLDGDLKEDLVFCVYWDQKLSWKKNLGNGTFGPEQIVSQNAKLITQFDAADFNNDSKMDLISVSFGDDKVAWYEGINGTGSFTPEKVLTTDVNSLNTVSAGDIDGDGDADIISLSRKNKIAWYKNTNGLGDFSGVQKIIRNDIRLQSQVTLADMDHDGDNDVVFMGEADPSITYRYAWLENDGAGNFAIEHPIVNLGMEPTYRNTIGDFNGDGKKDIAFMASSTKLKVAFNTGNGNFSAPQEFLNPAIGSVGILQNEDVDGDGDQDIIITNDGKIKWYENIDGLGNFTAEHVVASSSNGFTKLYFADLDGDGDRDISFVNANGNKIGWFENINAQGSFGPEKVISTGTAVSPYAIVAMDIDGDGRKDIVTNSQTQPKLRWYKNNGNGVFDATPQLITNNTGSVVSLLSADLNGDGIPELISGSTYIDNYKEDMISWFGTTESFQNKTKGKIKLDIDNNGCDANDTSASMMMVSTQNSAGKFSTFTDASGNYSILSAQGQHTTFIDASLPNYTVNPQNHTFNFASAGVTDTADFCIAPNQVYKDLDVSIYPVLTARPGFDTKYRMVVRNKGTQKLSGEISFTYNGAKMNFLQASSPVVSQTNGNIRFNYQDFAPLQTKTIDLKFNVLPMPVNSIGGQLSINGIANVTGDATPSDNEFALNHTIVGSYDPNDITVLEGSQILLQDADEYLHYIICFQNTGNHFAEKVRIHNVLDSKLDWSTLSLESYSHPSEVKVANGNDVTFNFNAIYLPGSSDEPNSHGFIAYKIKPKANVQMNDIVNNVADIYFDYNPAVHTNTVSTKIVDQFLGTKEQVKATVHIYPNPTTGIIYLNAQSVPEKVEVYNALGQKIRTSQNVSRIDISDLAAGTYILNITSKAEGVSTFKVIKK
ncbi:hypothetical protein J2787_003996 [Chryseobacterium rhizosphaerae]|uniref:Secretion system C-terminal sorting domain-containing protein n=1 Tax=Chryseobacterium rhizosphaerae TaxID=395937 RepID=A0AAE4C5H2_9FLAO|nr:T9SS type A sorting domain-containing protein [Chryseobacterium rhizosphaerae]MDR6528559.1 hypothetical protein [Chryseobacterium rhizosphaerae]